MSSIPTRLVVGPIVALAFAPGWVTPRTTEPSAAPPVVAIVRATLVNPNAAPVPDAVVVFTNGRVSCAGTRAACPIPAGAAVRDAAGGFIGPGLIDAHVHYSQTGWVDGRPDAADLRARYPYDSVVASLRDHSERFDRAYLCSGVTSVFDVGGYAWTLTMARRHEETTTAPRMRAAGPLMSTIDFWLNLPFARQFVFMGSDSAARTGVRALARMGASAIKVWYIQVPDSLQATMQHRLVVVGEEARRVGLPMIVHATDSREPRRHWLPARTSSFTTWTTRRSTASSLPWPRRTVPSSSRRSPSCTAMRTCSGPLAAARYPLDCVDRVTRAHLETPLSDSLRPPAARIERLKAVPARSAHNLAMLVAAGIPIAMGTDAGNPGTAAGPSVYAEMEAMQEAGMSAAAVFASATIGGARAMGRERELGSLEANKLADAVVFEADPTADIANARRVRLVIRGGVVYTRAQLLPTS